MLAQECERNQTFNEEWVNSITHLAGAFFTLIGTYFLVEQALQFQDQAKLISIIIYGASAFMTFLASAVYHGIESGPWKKYLRKIDHASIYVMIAGSYSPILLIPLKNDLGFLFFSMLWLLAISGVIWKLFYFNIKQTFSLGSYLLLGWLGVFHIDAMFASIPGDGLMLMLLGGLIYTAGAYFFINDHKKYYHAIWHLFTLVASALHYTAIMFFVLPIV